MQGKLVNLNNNVLCMVTHHLQNLDKLKIVTEIIYFWASKSNDRYKECTSIRWTSTYFANW